MDDVNRPDRTVIAHLPARQPLDLFSALGNLLDAALGGALLATGNGYDIAGSVVLPDETTTRDATSRLRAATRVLNKRRPKVLLEDTPAEGEPEVTFNGMREHADGSVGFGIGGDPGVAEAMAANLLAAFAPALTDAPSYVEFAFSDRDTGGQYAVIVVKPDGLTPHQARQRAEAEAARLRQQLADAEQAIRELVAGSAV